jgi:hypothetical protein
MLTYLETLRAIALAANDLGPLTPIDPDLGLAEAGMDGNYARQLQAARNLDAANEGALLRDYLAAVAAYGD